MASAKIAQLQLLQQNVQAVQAQKQHIEEELTELNSALTELKTTEKAYQIIGKLMFSVPKEELLKELEGKQEMSTLRLKNFTEQEEKLKKNVEIAQREVIEDLRKGKKNG